MCDDHDNRLKGVRKKTQASRLNPIGSSALFTLPFF